MRKFLSTALLGSAMLITSFAANAGEMAFSQTAFEKLQAEGKPAIVYFHADWCPTCKVQKPIVDSLLKQPDMQSITLLVADYDKEIALKKVMHISQQSTFVVFKGGKEVTRATGQTTKAAIQATFAQAL
ncbi:thioredoxin family protein [Glaciimonas sp. Cout2]|uniref:thioredoxin family protein n=1 Tax=Glaciimonas sp. Cout2 TaxID=3048621 RepID=UPI002B22FA2D|nr:thioredoxin family protein [Glaciimonas sp. Cout2]MEB0010468.1 thioredoxin family protein [Glaciimonas sp. Cout2]